jgi:hypothetical protein
MGTGHGKEGDASRGSALLGGETLLRRAGARTPGVRATVRAPPPDRNQPEEEWQTRVGTHRLLLDWVRTAQS